MIEIRGSGKETPKITPPYNEKLVQILRKIPSRLWNPNYTRQVQLFLHRTGIPAELVRREDVILYLEKLQNIAGHLNRSTAAHIISGLRALYCSMGKKGTGNPAEGIPYPKQELRYPDIISKEEVKRIIQAPRNLKHRLLLMLIYSAGLRVSEAVTLKLKDLDFERNLIHIQLGKGKKDRFVMLSRTIWAAYQEYSSCYPLKEWLFPGIDISTHLSIRSAQSIFYNAAERAGIKKNVSIHSLRHNFATRLLENGTDLRYIQELLGHKSSRTTEMYTHVSNRDIGHIPSPLYGL